jgi:hypothetical protein
MGETCAWCELDVDTADRQSIRLSNSQPPWSVRSGFGAAGAAAAAGQAFIATFRAMAAVEPPIVLWFHRPCWRKLLGVLRGVG